MKTPEENHFTQNLINGLKHTTTELEELKVQVALGKAEANDLIDETQKKLRQYIQHAKNKLENLRDKTSNAALEAKSEIESALKEMYNKI